MLWYIFIILFLFFLRSFVALTSFCYHLIGISSHKASFQLSCDRFIWFFFAHWTDCSNCKFSCTVIYSECWLNTRGLTYIYRKRAAVFICLVSCLQLAHTPNSYEAKNKPEFHEFFFMQIETVNSISSSSRMGTNQIPEIMWNAKANIERDIELKKHSLVCYGFFAETKICLLLYLFMLPNRRL